MSVPRTLPDKERVTVRASSLPSTLIIIVDPSPFPFAEAAVVFATAFVAVEISARTDCLICS